MTGGSSGDDFDVSIGTSANGTEIMPLRALLDDGGSAVTLTANQPVALISDGVPAGANAFATLGQPATSEAMTLSATTYSAAERTLHLNFKALNSGADLATANTTIKVIAKFATI